ncbi:hypothetical protein ACTGU5_00135 [Streptococcus suis]
MKKQSILAVAPFQFLGRKKKWSTLAVAPFQFLGRKLKTPIQGLNSLSYFKLMKK